MEDFKKDGKDQLPNFLELQSKIESHILPIQLLVAGFDGGKGQVFFPVGIWRKEGDTQPL